MEPLKDALRRALARWRLGADFGGRSPQGNFSRAGLRMLEKMTDRPVLNDTHGHMIFPTELRPQFANSGPFSAFRTVEGKLWGKSFLFALGYNHPLSERERTAFDLYSVAQAVGDSVDAQFVLLFAAIETLLEDRLLSKPVVDHVDELIARTKDADLDMAEKNSLLGSLNWLRTHSVRSSGRQFVRERLGDRKYKEQSAEDCFLACYDLRNRLLHGQQPFPTREEVAGLVSALDQIVSHILAGPILEFDSA